jgi:hypothetical protein
MHESWARTVGNDQVIASVCIDVPANVHYPSLHQKTFYGDYKLTEEDALESAKLAALLYLQKAGIITVDDINLSELTQCRADLANCQYKLLAASSWATTFQERVEALKAELALAHEENKKLSAASKVLLVYGSLPVL